MNSVIQSDLNDTSCPDGDYGVDPTEYTYTEYTDTELATVVVPETVHSLSDAQLTTFMHKVNSESIFEDFGVSHLLNVKLLFRQ